jgi:histidinol-phosphate aminotransferase
MSGAAAAALARQVGARGFEGSGAPLPAAQNRALITLDSNENPNGPSPAALNAIRGAMSLANRYPYEETGALTSAIARLHGVRTTQVILGCGSSEILRMAVQAYTSRTRPLVTALPTFETPREHAEAFGVPVRSVRLDASFRLNLAAMELDVPGAGLVYVCNPNNPTATALGASAIAGFVERVGRTSPQTAILIDEAYHEYVDDPAYRTSVALAAAQRNVIVSRTFSKIHGMAGLRCGYAVAHAETIAKLAPFKLAAAVNQFAIAAAVAALGDTERVARERTINRETREYTRKLFQTLGYSVGPSETNFVLLNLQRDARAFRDACRRAGVILGRPFPPLDTYARISIGTMDEMQRAEAVFRRALGA